MGGLRLGTAGRAVLVVQRFGYAGKLLVGATT